MTYEISGRDGHVLTIYNTTHPVIIVFPSAAQLQDFLLKLLITNGHPH
jgi:hypothetical protein